MGSDESCGICGKHYQSCPHFLKEHIERDDEKGKALCGRINVIMTDMELVKDSAVDPYNLCNSCIKSYERSHEVQVTDIHGDYSNNWGNEHSR